MHRTEQFVYVLKRDQLALADDEEDVQRHYFSIKSGLFATI